MIGAASCMALAASWSAEPPTRTRALMAGRLTVCPTPIGNMEDLSPRARRALEDADLVACEDTRRAGRLYERLEIPRPRLVSYHDAERGRARAAARRRRSSAGPGSC